MNSILCTCNLLEVTYRLYAAKISWICYMLPRIHWYDIYYKNSGFYDNLIVSWKLQDLSWYIYVGSYIHAAKISSHIGYMLPKFHHTDRLHIHAHKRCPTAQRHIFHTNCKYILDNRFNTPCHTKDTGSIQYVTYNISTTFAYFNTTATTNKMANTKNVTFRHPHTRQMQLPMPFLFLTTISFTLFTFSSMLSILSTSSGTSVVEPATMVEDNHYLEGTPHILPRTNTWNMSPASKLQQ